MNCLESILVIFCLVLVRFPIGILLDIYIFLSEYKNKMIRYTIRKITMIENRIENQLTPGLFQGHL